MRYRQWRGLYFTNRTTGELTLFQDVVYYNGTGEWGVTLAIGIGAETRFERHIFTRSEMDEFTDNFERRILKSEIKDQI